jgi:hypothetical protein
MNTSQTETTDLGDLVLLLLASTLAGLRDRLADDGFDEASLLVSQLANQVDHYLVGL